MSKSHSYIRKNIRLEYSHKVYFTKDSFSPKNDTLAEILQPHREGRRTKAVVFVDEGIMDGNPNLVERVTSYFRSRDDRLDLVCPPEFIRGGGTRQE
jgi:hypothetical protein